jgi:hypothetical protein
VSLQMPIAYYAMLCYAVAMLCRCPMDHVLSPTAWARAGVAHRDASFLDEPRFAAPGAVMDVAVVTRAEYDHLTPDARAAALPTGTTDGAAVAAGASREHTPVRRLAHARGLLCARDGGRAAAFNTMLCYAVLCCAMLCYATLRYATLRYAMLRYAMLCYATLCYATLCYAMLCYAMLCRRAAAFNSLAASVLRVPQWCAKCFQPCDKELARWLPADVIRAGAGPSPNPNHLRTPLPSPPHPSCCCCCVSIALSPRRPHRQRLLLPARPDAAAVPRGRLRAEQRERALVTPHQRSPASVPAARLSHDVYAVQEL